MVKWYDIHLYDGIRKLGIKGILFNLLLSFSLVIFFGKYTGSYDSAYFINSFLAFALGFKRKASISNQLVFSTFVIAFIYFITYQTQPHHMIHVSAGSLSLLVGILLGALKDKTEKKKPI
jgi:hypothetical protein